MRHSLLKLKDIICSLALYSASQPGPRLSLPRKRSGFGGKGLHANLDSIYSLAQNLEQEIPSHTMTDSSLQNPAAMSSTNLDYVALALDFEMTNVFNANLTDEAEEIYTCFLDPNSPLTGVDGLDWADIYEVLQAIEE
jgi:hypothetical protein